MSYTEHRVWRITPQTNDADCRSVLYLNRDVVPIIGPATQIVGMMYCTIVPGTLRIEAGKWPEFTEDRQCNGFAWHDPLPQIVPDAWSNNR